MNSTVTQNNSRFEFGLNIHLLSFTLPPNLIKNKEEVRVSITTMPEGNKQHFYIQGKKMNYSNHVFAVNVSNTTKNIVMVWRKKTFLTENPIIASKTIHLREFQNIPQQPITSGTVNTDVKVLNIYYPLQQQKQEIREERDKNGAKIRGIKRKVLGQMQVQLSFTTPYLTIEKEKSKKKSKNNNKGKNTSSYSNNSYGNNYEICSSSNNKDDLKASESKNHKFGKKVKINDDYQRLDNENGFGNYNLL